MLQMQMPNIAAENKLKELNQILLGKIETLKVQHKSAQQTSEDYRKKLVQAELELERSKENIDSQSHSWPGDARKIHGEMVRKQQKTWERYARSRREISRRKKA